MATISFSFSFGPDELICASALLWMILTYIVRGMFGGGWGIDVHFLGARLFDGVTMAVGMLLIISVFKPSVRGWVKESEVFLFLAGIIAVLVTIASAISAIKQPETPGLQPRAIDRPETTFRRDF